MIVVKPEQSTDASAIFQIHQQAFGRLAEAELVAALCQQVPAAISLVAWQNNQAVGHILFTPVTLEPTLPAVKAMGLAPLAVLPARQRQGIGSQLIVAGLAACRVQGYNAVIVIGHPAYYPRFGFVPAGEKGWRCEFPVPPEAFMVCELGSQPLDAITAMVRYHPAFARVA